jgi:hypothetical protein
MPIHKSRKTSKQTASHYLQAADIPVAEMDEIADLTPEPEPQPVTEPELEAVAEIGFEIALPEPVPEGISEPVLEPVPETGDEAARHLLSSKMTLMFLLLEITGLLSLQERKRTLGGATTLHEPVFLDYAQPNIR